MTGWAAGEVRRGPYSFLVIGIVFVIGGILILLTGFLSSNPKYDPKQMKVGGTFFLVLGIACILGDVLT